MKNIKNIINQYYQGWASQDLTKSRKVLSDDLYFRSPQDRFESANKFLNQCAHLAEGLEGVEFIKEVFTNDEAFVVLKWRMKEKQIFINAEYLRLQNNLIKEIIVVNNSMDFYKLFE